ncbi:MAG: 4'-phosphopantetheinyl transferase superfamily protein [Lewinellaceae bacterium]|nr:4'-phosphopantetheinyl transferase superfamily protein [Lewinellaceae bacterium]
MRHFTEEAIQLIDLSNEPGLAGVRLLLFDVAKLPNDLIFELGKLLSPQELRKAARFRFMNDRRVYLAGRGMLRKMASEVLGVPAENLVIGEGLYGKPYLADYGNLLPFNLSHSGDVVALAFDFGRREVGVDVEKINRSFEYWDVAGHYFSKKECDRVFNHRDFYRYWTMKEALLKVTGAGLVDDLPTMDLSGKMNRVKVADERLLPFKDKAFTIYTFDNEEIIFSLAVAGAQMTSVENEGVKVAHVYFY